MRKRTGALLLLILVAAFVPLSPSLDAPRVGSKKFTESVILGELVARIVAGCRQGGPLDAEGRLGKCGLESVRIQ